MSLSMGRKNSHRYFAEEALLDGLWEKHLTQAPVNNSDEKRSSLSNKKAGSSGAGRPPPGSPGTSPTRGGSKYGAWFMPPEEWKAVYAGR